LSLTSFLTFFVETVSLNGLSHIAPLSLNKEGLIKPSSVSMNEIVLKFIVL